MIEELTFSNFSDFLTWVSERQAIALRSGAGMPALWYRGQRNAAWRLWAKLTREAQKILEYSGQSKHAPGCGPFRALARELEQQLYSEFKRRVWPLLTVEQRDPWDLLFTAQHHGLPTRLLDWTETLGVAVYFATNEDAPEGTDFAVFVLDHEWFNRVSANSGEPIAPGHDQRLRGHHPNDRAFDNATDLWPPSIALQPPHNNERMVRQRGTFVLTGGQLGDLTDDSDLTRRWNLWSEKQFPNPILTKCTLRASTHAHARAFLRNAGIEESSLFPDISHLASAITQERTTALRLGLADPISYEGVVGRSWLEMFRVMYP